MMALEEAFQTTLEESALSGSDRTIAEIEALVDEQGCAFPVPRSRFPFGVPFVAQDPRLEPQDRPDGCEAARAIDFPCWNRSRLAWLLRRVSLPTWILPLGAHLHEHDGRGSRAPSGSRGPGHVRGESPEPPGHAGDHDALPARWRYRLAPAMAKEFFKAHFNPRAVLDGERGSPTASTTTSPVSSSMRFRCRSARRARGRRCATSAR